MTAFVYAWMIGPEYVPPRLVIYATVGAKVCSLRHLVMKEHTGDNIRVILSLSLFEI